jgi:hypothetical protein
LKGSSRKIRKEGRRKDRVWEVERISRKTKGVKMKGGK